MRSVAGKYSLRHIELQIYPTGENTPLPTRKANTPFSLSCVSPTQDSVARDVDINLQTRKSVDSMGDTLKDLRLEIQVFEQPFPPSRVREDECYCSWPSMRLGVDVKRGRSGTKSTVRTYSPLGSHLSLVLSPLRRYV